MLIEWPLPHGAVEFGNSHDRAKDDGERCGRHAGHGRIESLPDMSIYTLIRLHGFGVGARVHFHSLEGRSHRQQFVSLQHAVRNLQAIHQREAAKEGEFNAVRFLLWSLWQPTSPSFQIFFQNKDWKALTSHIRPEALRSRYGGTLDVPETNGALLADLMTLYNKEFESEFILVMLCMPYSDLNMPFSLSLLPQWPTHSDTGQLRRDKILDFSKDFS